MIDSNNKLKSLSRALLESAQSILSEKKEVKKDLANLAPPYNKITHADVLVGRGALSHDDVVAHKAKKGIKEDAQMVVIHAPVLGDIDGELAEVLKRDPRDKTVHVQYEGMKYILKAGQYKELDEAVNNPYAVGMAAAMKSTGDTPPLKKSTITKAHEIAKAVKEEAEVEPRRIKLTKGWGDGGKSMKAGYGKLTGNQHEIDANNNGKVDAHDFHLLRKKKKVAEEAEQIDEASVADVAKTAHLHVRAGKHDSIHTAIQAAVNKHFPSSVHSSVTRKKVADQALSRIQSSNAPKMKNEEVEQFDEATFAPTMRKAIAAHERGDHKMTKYHLDNAKTARYAMKSTEISKHKDLLDKYKELRGLHEGVDEGLTPDRKSLLGRYINKAKDQIDGASWRTGYRQGIDPKADATNSPIIKSKEKQLSKRHKGIEMAVNKLTREEAEGLDEISSDMAHRYLKGKRERDYDISPDGTSSKLKKPQSFAKMDKDVKSSMRALRTIEKAKKTNEDVENIDETAMSPAALIKNKIKKAEANAKARDPHTKIEREEARVGRMLAAKSKQRNEEVEQIDELSHDTLRNYRMKAKSIADNEGGKDRSQGRDLAGRKSYGGRMGGIPKAKVMASEEVENIDELSSKTLFSYGKKARKEADKLDDPMHRAGGRLLASKKTNPARGGYKLTKVAATFGEDVELSQEEIDFIEATMADLEEGRGRPPKEGSAAWKAKQQQDLADMPALGVQIRKAASINKPVTFMDGHSKQISNDHINRFHDHMDSRKTSQDKSAFQKRAHKSHDEFVKAVSEPVPGRAKDTGEIVKYK